MELEIDGVPGKFYTPYGLESLFALRPNIADKEVINRAHRWLTGGDIQGYSQQNLFDDKR